MEKFEEKENLKEWRTKSSETVINRMQSHIHGEILDILPEVLSKVETKGQKFLVKEVDLKRIIGNNTCVETNSSDQGQIVYARRPGRNGYTRFVKNRSAQPCSTMVIILKRSEEKTNTMILITAFIGHKPEPEPWDKHATANSLDFWQKHALIWGSEEVEDETETKNCPW